MKKVKENSRQTKKYKTKNKPEKRRRRKPGTREEQQRRTTAGGKTEKTDEWCGEKEVGKGQRQEVEHNRMNSTK